MTGLRSFNDSMSKKVLDLLAAAGDGIIET